MIKLIVIAALVIGGLQLVHDAGFNLDNVEPRQVRMLSNI